MRRERRSERGGPSERARAFLSLMQPFFRRSLLTCPPLDGAETARAEKAIKVQSPSQKSGGKKRAERGGGERKVFSFLRLRRRPRKVAGGERGGKNLQSKLWLRAQLDPQSGFFTVFLEERPPVSFPRHFPLPRTERCSSAPRPSRRLAADTESASRARAPPPPPGGLRSLPPALCLCLCLRRRRRAPPPLLPSRRRRCRPAPSPRLLTPAPLPPRSSASVRST